MLRNSSSVPRIVLVGLVGAVLVLAARPSTVAVASSTAAAGAVPAFIQVGKKLNFGKNAFLVLEIDRTGWIKVEHWGTEEWMNVTRIDSFPAQ